MERALKAVLAALVLSLGNSQDRRNMPRTAPGQQKEFYPNPNGVRHPNDYQRNQRFNDYQKTDETSNNYQDNDYQLQGGDNEMQQSETNNRTKSNAESDDGGNSKSETSDPEYCSRPYPKYPIRSTDMPDWCCAKPKPKKLGNLEGVLQKCCISMETKEEKCDSVCLDMDPRVTDKPLDGKPMQTKWTFVLTQETSSIQMNNSAMSASHLKGDCQEFKYSGSGGNENNFETKAECEESCPYGMPDNEEPLTECQKKSDNGKSYVGKVNMSKNGKKCRKWSKVWSRWAVTYPEEFDGCRNPDNEKGGVWCYVYKPDEKSTGGAVPGKRMAGRAWEHCYVKFCDGTRG